jgi:hypothetical protein
VRLFFTGNLKKVGAVLWATPNGEMERCNLFEHKKH